MIMKDQCSLGNKGFVVFLWGKVDEGGEDDKRQSQIPWRWVGGSTYSILGPSVDTLEEVGNGHYLNLCKELTSWCNWHYKITG